MMSNTAATAEISAGKRLHYLDGLRGMAALMVLFCHFRLMFDESFESRSLAFLNGTLHNKFLADFVQAFLNMLSNGPLAVFIFWFMSGYVISVPLFSPNGMKYLPGAFVKRYFRLALPALASVLVAYCLLLTGAIFNQQFFVPDQSNHWLHLFYQFHANFFTAIQNGLWDTFFNYNEALSYNASLWTMEQELYGSFLCFFLFAIFRTHPKRFIVYGIILGIFFIQNRFPLITFMGGFILCDLDHANGSKHPILLWLEEQVFAKSFYGVLLLCAVVFFAGHKTHVDMRDMLSSGAIVIIISRTNFLKKLLTTPVFKYLGDWSFALYLLHLPVLCSLTCALYNFFGGSHTQKVLYASSISLVVIVSAAALFTAFVDKPAIRFANKLAKTFNQIQNEAA